MSNPAVKPAANPWAHVDGLLAQKPGTVLMACDLVQAVNLGAGGMLTYPPGARFRISANGGHGLFCLDEQNRSIVLNRESLQEIEVWR